MSSCVRTVFVHIQERYSGFDKGIGKKIEDGSATLEELEVNHSHASVFLALYQPVDSFMLV